MTKVQQLRLRRRQKRARQRKRRCPYCKGKGYGVEHRPWQDQRWPCPACSGQKTLAAATANILAGEFDPEPYCHKFFDIEDWCDFGRKALAFKDSGHQCHKHYWQTAHALQRKCLGKPAYPA